MAGTLCAELARQERLTILYDVSPVQLVLFRILPSRPLCLMRLFRLLGAHLRASIVARESLGALS